MPFADYTPSPVQLVTLSEADGSEPLGAGTTNVSLEQLADGVQYLNERAIQADGTGEVVGDYTWLGDQEFEAGISVAEDVDVGGAVHWPSDGPASTADPGENNAYSTNQCKVWGRIYADGVGGVAVLDGYNIASVTIVGATSVDVTFARAFANNNYAPQLTNLTAVALVPCVDYLNSTASKVRIQMRDLTNTLIDPSSAVARWSLEIHGRQ